MRTGIERARDAYTGGCIKDVGNTSTSIVSMCQRKGPGDASVGCRKPRSIKHVREIYTEAGRQNLKMHDSINAKTYAPRGHSD